MMFLYSCLKGLIFAWTRIITANKAMLIVRLLLLSRADT